MKAIHWLSLKNIFLVGAALLFSHTSWGSITNLQAANDSTNVYYSYTYTGTPAYLRIYLDTDRNASTGFQYKTIGANYLIENGSLYKYAGSGGTNWAWTLVGSSQMVKSSGQVKWTIARSNLGSPSATNLVANTSAGDNSAVLTQTLSTSTSTTTTSTTSTTLTTTTSTTLSTTTTTLSTTTTTTSTSTTTTLASTMNSVSYGESSANIPNPERGFLYHVSCDTDTLSLSTLQSWRSTDGNSLIRCMFYLKNYKTGPLPQSVLDFFQKQMNTLRSGGFKAVVRFAYTENMAGDDAPLSVVLGHLNQLAPYLQNNSDVINNMEAGFIGAWGEWAYSQNFGNSDSLTPQNWTDRKTVMDKILAVLPSTRMVKLRTPAFKMKLYGSTALADSEAFNGTARARVGQHNDCFLASPDDWGTYTNTSTDYPWLAQETRHLPMGGETCNYNPPRSDCPTALQEMEKFHWSDINQSYLADVLNSWKSQGCFPTMKNRLGYRFVLLNGSFSNTAKVGGVMNLSLNLVNRGFASPLNPRGLELILRNTSTGAVYHVALNADPRFWLPGSTITLNQSVTLPSSVPAGNYSLLLNLPDPMSTLYGRPEYSIQLANMNTWESSTGFNKLNATLTVNP